jgi:hypothetical protein
VAGRYVRDRLTCKAIPRMPFRNGQGRFCGLPHAVGQD